jgi:hypothetical protein
VKHPLSGRTGGKHTAAPVEGILGKPLSALIAKHKRYLLIELIIILFRLGGGTLLQAKAGLIAVLSITDHAGHV